MCYAKVERQQKFFRERFGLIYVDFDDDERPRIPKASAEYYANVIKTRCILEDGSCVE